MKWKHKTLGWIAETGAYSDKIHMKIPEYVDYQHAKISRESKEGFNAPISFVLEDKGWKEIPDERWLEYKFTIREFMEAFSMVISDSGGSHDSCVAKKMADSVLSEHIERNYLYNKRKTIASQEDGLVP